jgi:thiamine-phosphate pyrophosphorylase
MERIQFISQGNNITEQLTSVHKALDAGCRWIQLRCKWGTEIELRELAGKVKLLCSEYNAQFLINDHVNLTLDTEADGVHLGLDDLPIQEARRILGNHRIIGGTANTLQHLQRRIEEGCNYIGLGPLRFTPTKQNLSPILGIQGYKNLLSSVDPSIPIIAIGGIQAMDIEELLEAGVYGVAISGAIVNAANPKTLIEIINEKFRRPIKDSR